MQCCFRFGLTNFLLLALLVPSPAQKATQFQVTEPPASLKESLKLSPFYKKFVDVEGFPVLGSEKTSDFALREAAFLIRQMLVGRDDIRDAMIQSKVRFAVMATTEMTTVIPEHSDLTPPKYWDRRARGLGATPHRPTASCGEENLLEYQGDPYKGENILIHEVAHVIHEMGERTIDKTFQARLETIYQSALQKGLWRGTYAATNPSEYWAEGVQSWFDCNQKPNHDHNEIDTRKELTAYDPELAKLIASVFRTGKWRYTPPSKRKKQAHLQGYNPTTSPTFAWDPELVRWYVEYEKQQRSGK